MKIYNNKTEYNTIYTNTVQYNNMQHRTVQYNTVQYNTIQYSTIQYNTIQYNTIQNAFIAPFPKGSEPIQKNLKLHKSSIQLKLQKMHHTDLLNSKVSSKVTLCIKCILRLIISWQWRSTHNCVYKLRLCAYVTAMRW